MCICLTACGSSDKKAFETSGAAYDHVDIACEITQQFGSDIYGAWHAGIYHVDEILDGGTAYLATELSLGENELREGIGYVLTDMTGEDWFTLSDEDRTTIIENADYIFAAMEDDMFSFCVQVVVGAYTTNGKIDEARNALDTAKALMKELSENYSDYEHYPSLKGYYTSTSAFFDFCLNPTGSFSQVKDTINKYENEIRDYVNSGFYL